MKHTLTILCLLLSLCAAAQQRDTVAMRGELDTVQVVSPPPADLAGLCRTLGLAWPCE